MLRVTPDVNTLIEGTISRRGPAGAILAAWESGHLALVLAEEILAEYEEVLSRPRIRERYAHLTPATVAAHARTLREHGLVIALAEIPPVILEDPDDDAVLACAASGSADYIVSRDRHLLRRVEHRGISILTPEAFLPILGASIAG